MLSEVRVRAVYDKALEMLVIDLTRAGASPALIERVRTQGVSGLERMRWGDPDPVLWNELVQKMGMVQALEIVLEMSPA